jgi:tRNA pseudouridine38-40 synthase
VRFGCPGAALVRIALGIEYDGSGFHGWQTQPGGLTVQDVLEGALATIAGHPVPTICAGRTDTGVHATDQVVHFDTETSRPLAAWVRGTNSQLPAGVSVVWSCETVPDFHARFDALSRTYRYWLLPRAARPGLLQRRIGWWHGGLDVPAMQAAAARLVGEHDFSAFRAAECQARTPVRTLHRCDVASVGPYVRFEFQANAFLQHMVRNMVGALVYVGAGRATPDGLTEILETRDRRRAPPTFSPDGLYLTAVEYPATAGLPPRDPAPHFP